ncbi:MAG: helix-turn-helix domain-containing protein [Clostridia bacterium]|nr:helix-turn-helix domain-containing protein [Clostridia bacterium]
MATVNVNVRMDEELKDKLHNLVSKADMDMSTFFVMSAKQAVKEQKFSFDAEISYPDRGKDIVSDIIEFLKCNIGKKIVFDDVVNYVHASRTTVKNAFSKEMGMGVMKYYNILKIEKAKQYIADGRYNMSQIANLLGYDSVHYFSKQFKSIVDVPPTEYAKTVWPNYDKKEKENKL